ncbi:hypothetical protein N657DRAFT_643157 [Parathielavia appendiculata]|uniref:Uncharacterized protein n=1 Tax=Parathielavia appendiculata TaxID=2587402 RepID=A0AAN6Z6T8_9PEZI|nr:hypothetical protein N657DRAFT_643157 [Parathielavia appendiculata]
MLVIRVLWLQAALATAQLLDLNGTLGGGNGSSTPTVEDEVAPGADGPGDSLDGLAGDAGAGSGGILDPVLDAVIGPTKRLGNNEGPAATSVQAQNPPVTTIAEPASEPEPTVVEPATETPAPAPTLELAPAPVPEPTSELRPVPSTVIEQVPSVQTTKPPAEQQQQQPALAPIPVPETSTTPEPALVRASSAAAAPASSPADSTVIQIPSPSASPAQGTSFREIIAPVPVSTTARPSPPTEEQASPSGEPILMLITASGSTFMSVFVPPSPTGAVAAIDGANDLSSGPNNGDTDPFQTSPESDPDENGNNTNAGLGGGTASNTTRAGTDSRDTNDRAPSDIPLPTRIGIGIGVGAGSILTVVIITVVFWKRRMSRHGPPSDSERGMSPTPQDKAKMDVESEHDLAFDFGGFFRDRVRRNPSHGSQGSLGSVNTVHNSMQGQAYGGDVKVPDMGMSRAYVQVQQQPQAVLELDGGAMPLYRGVVGVGR